MKSNNVFLFFPCNGNIGGAERRLVRSFTRIMQREIGFRFTLGLLPVKKIEKDKIVQEYRQLTNAPIVVFKNKPKVFSHILHTSYDYVCYTDCSFRCLPALIASLVSRKKRLMICADTIGSSQSLKPRLKQTLYNIDIRLSNRIDCLYPSNTEILKAKFKHKPISCTPCSFTDMEKYRPIYPKRKEIVFLGRLIECKGIMLFAEAVVSISDEIRAKGFICNVYGSGNQEKEIIRIIEEHGCTDIVHIQGHINDSAEALHRSMIFCSLQTYGNYPSQSLLEALACGNYCIVTDVSDSHLLIKDSFGSLIEQNKETLAAALLKAMEILADQYEAIGKESREFLLNHHTVERSAEYYDAVLSS